MKLFLYIKQISPVKVEPDCVMMTNIGARIIEYVCQKTKNCNVAVAPPPH